MKYQLVNFSKRTLESARKRR